jgi:divalent metal cation (Fe/Co/Zn/Cd) transporter
LTENITILIDGAAVDIRIVERIALSVPGVHGCHRVRSRSTGDTVHLDLHLLVDGDQTLRHAHELAHQVEEVLRAQLPEVADVTIHVEPEDDAHETL